MKSESGKNGKYLYEELIKQIQELLDSGKGDAGRLTYILDTVKSGKNLYLSDQKYIENLLQTTLSQNQEIPTDVPVNVTSEPKENPVSEISHNKPIHKGKTVAVICIIAAIIVAAYIVTNAYAVTTLEFRPYKHGQYVISETMVHIQAQSCNPSYFPASFSSYEINAFYNSTSIEKASISGGTISPKSSLVLGGTFTVNKPAIVALMSQNSQFDSTLAHVTTKIDAPIFGIIPFSITKNYLGQEFQNVVSNGTPGSYGC